MLMMIMLRSHSFIVVELLCLQKVRCEMMIMIAVRQLSPVPDSCPDHRSRAVTLTVQSGSVWLQSSVTVLALVVSSHLPTVDDWLPGLPAS